MRALTPTLGCGWRSGITHQSPAAGWIRRRRFRAKAWPAARVRA